MTKNEMGEECCTHRREDLCLSLKHYRCKTGTEEMET
jgi:hypothetical protein